MGFEVYPDVQDADVHEEPGFSHATPGTVRGSTL